MMVFKDEVCMWFRNNEPHRRLDLLCGLINMCFPIELRFVSTCVSYLCKKDDVLREMENKANNTDDLNLVPCVLDERTRSKLVVLVALLNSANYACSKVLSKILLDSNKDLISQDKNYVKDMLLIYTMILNHPAFTFQQKQEISCLLADLQKAEKLSGKGFYEYYPCGNNVEPEACDSGLSIGTEPEIDSANENSSNLPSSHDIPSSGDTNSSITKEYKLEKPLNFKEEEGDDIISAEAYGTNVDISGDALFNGSPVHTTYIYNSDYSKAAIESSVLCQCSNSASCLSYSDHISKEAPYPNNSFSNVTQGYSDAATSCFHDSLSQSISSHVLPRSLSELTVSCSDINALSTQIINLVSNKHITTTAGGSIYRCTSVTPSVTSSIVSHVTQSRPKGKSTFSGHRHQKHDYLNKSISKHCNQGNNTYIVKPFEYTGNNVTKSNTEIVDLDSSPTAIISSDSYVHSVKENDSIITAADSGNVPNLDVAIKESEKNYPKIVLDKSDSVKCSVLDSPQPVAVNSNSITSLQTTHLNSSNYVSITPSSSLCHTLSANSAVIDCSVKQSNGFHYSLSSITLTKQQPMPSVNTTVVNLKSVDYSHSDHTTQTGSSAKVAYSGAIYSTANGIQSSIPTCGMVSIQAQSYPTYYPFHQVYMMHSSNSVRPPLVFPSVPSVLPPRGSLKSGSSSSNSSNSSTSGSRFSKGNRSLHFYKGGSRSSDSSPSPSQYSSPRQSPSPEGKFDDMQDELWDGSDTNGVSSVLNFGEDITHLAHAVIMPPNTRPRYPNPCPLFFNYQNGMYRYGPAPPVVVGSRGMPINADKSSRELTPPNSGMGSTSAQVTDSLSSVNSGSTSVNSTTSNVYVMDPCASPSVISPQLPSSLPSSSCGIPPSGNLPLYSSPGYTLPVTHMVIPGFLSTQNSSVPNGFVPPANYPMPNINPDFIYSGQYSVVGGSGGNLPSSGASAVSSNLASGYHSCYSNHAQNVHIGSKKGPTCRSCGKFGHKDVDCKNLLDEISRRGKVS